MGGAVFGCAGWTTGAGALGLLGLYAGGTSGTGGTSGAFLVGLGGLVTTGVLIFRISSFVVVSSLTLASDVVDSPSSDSGSGLLGMSYRWISSLGIPRYGAFEFSVNSASYHLFL